MSEINKKFYLQKFDAEERVRVKFQRQINETLIALENFERTLKHDSDNLYNQYMYELNTVIYEKSVSYLKNLTDNCSHDLVIYLGKQFKSENDIGCAVCVSCERMFYLKDIDKNIQLDPDLIINVAGIIPSEYICEYNGSQNILVRRAKEKLLKLADLNMDMTLEEVKQNILEDLVYFTDTLEERKVVPRKRTRNLIDKK